MPMATQIAKNVGSALYCRGGLQLTNAEFANHAADSSIIHIHGPEADVHINQSRLINSTSSGLLLDVDESARLLMDGESAIDD